MKFFVLLWLGVFAFFPAFPQAVRSDVYSCSAQPVAEQTGYQEQTLLEGSTRDFSHCIIQAITISANQPAQSIHQFDEEVVLIVKAGELTLTLDGNDKTLESGSLVMIMPGDSYRVENKAGQPLSYYQLRYTSNEMPDLDLYRLAGSSFWIDRQQMTATADQPGSSRQLIPYPTVMSNRVAVQVRTVDPRSEQDSSHTHRAAELLLILDNPVQVQIEDVLKRAQVGDLVFIESAVAHRIYSGSTKGCSYLSFQF